LVHRWRAALPHYDLQLESVRARGLDLPKGVFVVGNYVGGIGVPMLPSSRCPSPHGTRDGVIAEVVVPGA
jgi:hypothetical protein